MATTCTNINDLYANVEHCAGQVNLPGTKNHFYFIRKLHLVKWPTLPGNAAASLDKAAVYVGDFTLAADAKWHKVDTVPGETEPKSEQVGAYGSYHFNNTVSVVVPGTGELATGLISELNNDDVVVAVPTMGGKIRIIGDKSYQVTAKPSQAWGKASGDSNSTTIEFSCESMAATPFYPGKLITEEGTIDGSTDEIATTTE